MNRPSGLTALAIFNFITAGLYLLRALGMLIALSQGAAGKAAGGLSESAAETYLLLELVYSVLDGTLLLVAGLGYMKLKRVMGRFLGTGEAILGIVYFIGTAILLLNVAGRHLIFGQLPYLVYPGITLILLNIVFRENLVN